MICIQTGNALDVVLSSKPDLAGQKEVGMKVIGLRRHGSNVIIPLPDPKGLLAVLQLEAKAGRF